ncbi:gamma carbonic anhydrase family protein [Solicola sp. PLA-1-18]|uniref:gamma carbonic anhydrase family protein n=1 Tax=Solicola sp. PLA-1-18 TaxID=3380532 RepID=UPI003B7D0DED
MTDPHVVRPANGSTPVVHKTAWIAPGAVVVGDVTLEAGASLWYNAVLRGDKNPIVIGEDSNVQDCCVGHVDDGHPLTLGRRVSVGHGAVLHGCTVEDDCLIGMNATVLNGAVVGEGSMVAAGAVVLQDTVVPPRSLVAGVPGKVRRELTDEEIEAVRANGLGYLDIRDWHRAED